jgi:hypothetical protein
LGGRHQPSIGGFTQALWDLKTQPPTYDFAVFLIVCATLGAKHVHFRDEGEIQTKKFGAEIGWNRFKNIILPLCDIARFTYSRGPGGEGMVPGRHYGTVEALYQRLGRVFKFPLIDGPRGYSTVTLRHSFRNEDRNSGPAWKPFIEELSKRTTVIVLPECELDPIPMETRMRLYSNADMNYGVSNGPLALCHLSDAPYRTFKMIVHDGWRKHMADTGFPEGSQFSFRNDRQLLIYEDDTLDVLMRHIDDWRLPLG